jgi:hypothetical protein
VTGLPFLDCSYVVAWRMRKHVISHANTIVMFWYANKSMLEHRVRIESGDAMRDRHQMLSDDERVKEKAVDERSSIGAER